MSWLTVEWATKEHLQKLANRMSVISVSATLPSSRQIQQLKSTESSSAVSMFSSSARPCTELGLRGILPGLACLGIMQREAVWLIKERKRKNCRSTACVWVPCSAATYTGCRVQHGSENHQISCSIPKRHRRNQIILIWFAFLVIIFCLHHSDHYH